MEDFETWVGRLAAIRSWERGTPGYQGLEALFLDFALGLRKELGDADGRTPIPALTDRLVNIAEAGGTELDAWAYGFFQLLDANEDGVIGPDEYRDLMASVSLDGAMADECFARLDLDGDGHLSHEEFHQLYLEFFRSEDPDAPGSWLWGRVA